MIGLEEDDVENSVARLTEKTIKGLTQWKVWKSEATDSPDADEFMTETPTFDFYIRSVTNAGTTRYIFQIWRGTAVENDLTRVKVGSLVGSFGSPRGILLKELFEAARVSAYGFQNIKEELTQELE
jgi:hypothetical protein